MPTPEIVFHPMISFIQKVALYETRSTFYLIGSNNTQTRFRVLNIDRTEPRELIVVDDKMEYNLNEIHDLVNRIEISNRTKPHQRSGSVGKLVSAFAIVGFTRFLEGYYIILVTKRQRVALIGYHTIYKIKDTVMIYIPQDGCKNSNPEEQKYLKMFQSIDLSSNFYYSYSYNLSQSLQYNLSPPSDFPLDSFKQDQSNEQELFEPAQVLEFGVRSKPNDRFVWNTYLLQPVIDTLHPDWVIYVMHGFVGQSNMCVYGKSIYVTLIARRSRKYAGTRFLKRGANFEGDVANEVETEQMIHDSCISSFIRGHFSSFVQMRGSTPAHWSQGVTKMVPKPQISFDLSDPYAETAGKHFNQLLSRYGSPIIILNLVKKREKKKHESMLSQQINSSVRYLNQFLPPVHHIQYLSFDMARMNKIKDANVMQKLADIAYSSVLKTGIFINQPLASHPLHIGHRNDDKGPCYQTGVIRVNCVDCLDRTNTAQFALGKCALGFQLCALGILQSPKLEFDTDCVRMLEELYEDHGDTLALQYGGSQLVHRIKSYRKTAPWTSQGNDIMQTLSRYYSNTFSDADKQNTINLFLGLFVPEQGKANIWETATDYYLHHVSSYKKQDRPLSQWWGTGVLGSLPRSHQQLTKTSTDILSVFHTDELVDGYTDYHRPFELSVLADMFAYNISNSVRDFMPNFTVDFSPFVVRVRAGRRREESGSKNSAKNPSLTGQSSTSSTNSSSTSSSTESEETISDDEFELVPGVDRHSPSKESASLEYVSFDTLFPSMKQVYGCQPEEPTKSDTAVYKRYVYLTTTNARRRETTQNHFMKIFQSTDIPPTDSCYQVQLPIITEESIKTYQEYVSRGVRGCSSPSQRDLEIYKEYVKLR